jgi:hypothetical protein
MPNYQPVSHGTNGFETRCVSCDQRISTTSGTVYADLEGEPFRAYYCPRCAGVEQSVLACGCVTHPGNPDTAPARLCATGNRLLDELFDANQRRFAAKRSGLTAAKQQRDQAARAYNRHIGRVSE